MDKPVLAADVTMKSGFQIAALRDRPPWWGGDLQTLRNRFATRDVPLPSYSWEIGFATSDGSGDRLVGKLEKPLKPCEGTPLILLIHGLTGCQDSTYVRETARFHLERGRTVIRLNLRGAGPGRKVARGYYHAGCAGDVLDVLEGLGHAQAPYGVFAIGFSLGGNILLNLLASLPHGHRLIGAATVSAPIEPIEACRRLMQPRNVLYHRWLLHRMKSDVLASAELSAAERREIESARSVYEFDDRWVAPRHGFQGASDYYERTAGARCVATIEAPTLMLHAMNDPWIPAAPYERLRHHRCSAVQVVVARSGGHVGFHEYGHAETWHDRTINAFLERVRVRDRPLRTARRQLGS
jgi:hypothetical protein